MANIKMTETDKKLTLEIDLTKDSGPSKSGKTIIIASTGPGVKLEKHPEITLGLNIYKKA